MLNAMEDQVKHFLLVVVTLTALAAGLSYYSFWQGMISKLVIAWFHETFMRRQMVLLRRNPRARAAASASRTAAAFSRKAATATVS